MTKSNAVKENLVTGYSQIYPSILITDSQIEGKGIFTEVDLPRGTVIFDIVAEKISYKNSPEMSEINPNWIGCGFEEWLKVGPGDIASYLNHSCNPNAIINENPQLITMAPIRKGQELLIDYSTTELDPYWKMDCSCGAKNCRKILRSFQFLPPDLQTKYGVHLAPSFTYSSKERSVGQGKMV